MSELIATKEYLLKAVGAVINSREIPKIPEDINQDLLMELVVKNSLQAIGYIAFAKQDFKMPSDKEMTKAEAENTPEAQKLKRSKAKSAYRESHGFTENDSNAPVFSAKG